MSSQGATELGKEPRGLFVAAICLIIDVKYLKSEILHEYFNIDGNFQVIVEKLRIQHLSAGGEYSFRPIPQTSLWFIEH